MAHVMKGINESMRTDFTFMSKDGRTPVHAVKWTPGSGNIRAILQMSHGMQEFIDRYAPFAEYQAENGFLVVGHDHIGHGKSIVTEKDWGYFAPGNAGKILVQDMHQLRVLTQKEYPGVPYFMLGHSMGSFLLRRYIISKGKGLSGAIIMGSGYTEPHSSEMGILLASMLAKVFGWRHRSVLLTQLAFRKNHRFDMTGKDLENNWLTKDPEIVKWYYSQPGCTYTFTLNGYRNLFETVRFSCLQENVDRVWKKLPILLVSGAEDSVGGYGEGVRKILDQYRHAGVRDLKMVLYEGDRHEILNETDREKVFADLRDWMLKRI